MRGVLWATEASPTLSQFSCKMTDHLQLENFHHFDGVIYCAVNGETVSDSDIIRGSLLVYAELPAERGREICQLSDGSCARGWSGWWQHIKGL